jgi:hypothetical protein
MFLGGIMFSFINKKVVLVIAAIVAMLLVLEPTSNLTVEVLSTPSNLAWTLLGFLVGIINWGMLVMVAIGFTVAYLARTRTIDWSQVKAYFRSEEA